MSKENLVKLMEAATEDEQLMQQLQSADSYEAVKTLAAERGLDLGDLSAAEAQRTMGVVAGKISEELSDEELELVAGGISLNFEEIKVTLKGFKGLVGDDIGAV